MTRLLFGLNLSTSAAPGADPAGRLILGPGGGYSDEEFRAFGLTVPSPRDKVDGLAEAIAITRGLWSEPTFTYRGRLYSTEAAELEPKADHRIPIRLGTYGPRALALTGRAADGWIPSLGFAPPDQVGGLHDRVLAGLAGLGFTAFNLQPGGPDPAEQVERLANEVVPAVRTALGP